MLAQTKVNELLALVKVLVESGMSFWNARKLYARLYWSFASRFADGVAPSIRVCGMGRKVHQAPPTATATASAAIIDGNHFRERKSGTALGEAAS